MTLVASLSDQIDRLVHPSARISPVDAALHRTFIVTRLAVSLGAVAFVPIYLAIGKIPGSLDAAILGALVIPIVAVAHVSKSGKLVEGEVLSIASWALLSFLLVAGGVGSAGVSVSMLLVMLLEANLCNSVRVTGVTMLVALSMTLSIVLARSFGLAHATASQIGPAFFSLAAIYGAMLSFEGSRCRKIRQSIDSLDAERYRVLSESIGDLVLRFDRGGTVLLASQSCERLFGIKAQDLLRRGFFDHVHVADRPFFLTMIADAAGGLENVTGTFRFRVPARSRGDGTIEDASFAWVEMRSRRLDYRAGESFDASEGCMIAVVRDITTRILHQEEIERAKRDAEDANAWKDRFLATVSHELRTPLNAIIGFSEILASDTLVPTDAAKRREYADIIFGSGQHLLSVVNSLLDLSKIDLGRFDLTIEAFDMADLVRSCCDMVGLKANERHIALVRDFAPAGEIFGDKRACKQIVINLLSNALKFTPEHGIVTVRLRPDGSRIELAVADTGIGIKAADLSRLGDPFFQVHTGYDRPYEGTGLGLSVVTGLVGLHGGTVSVDSTPGQGTCMTVHLPRDCRAEERPDPAGRPRIEIMSRYARPNSPFSSDPLKVQKIA